MNNDRVRMADVSVLSDDWYTLRKSTFDYRVAIAAVSGG